MRSSHWDKVGLGGTLVTLACCLGFGPLLAVMSAVGVGFLLRDTILAPLLAAFLVLGGIGLTSSRGRHHSWRPLGLHITAAVLLLTFTFLIYFQPLIWLGVIGLLGAVVWDWILLRHRSSCENG